MADYIGVDFRDGTGPSALPPNDVARVFRDAEDSALLGRDATFWSGLVGEHGGAQATGGGREGGVWGSLGRGRVRGAKGGRRRVVHVESATTGKFFKVMRSSLVAKEIKELRGVWGFSLAVISAAKRWENYVGVVRWCEVKS